MVGTVEEFEKEIEQFQNNVMASGELVELLRQTLEQMKKQNESFDRKALDVIEKVDSIPITIERANYANNSQIKSDVEMELGQAVTEFRNEQNRYLQGLEQTQVMIKTSEDKLDVTYKEFISTVEKMNLSALYEQNQKLQSELNKRTLILAVISGISVLLGIIGLIV